MQIQASVFVAQIIYLYMQTLKTTPNPRRNSPILCLSPFHAALCSVAASFHDIPPPRFCCLLVSPPPFSPPSRCCVPSHCILAMFPPPPLVASDPSDEFEREILREFAFVDFDFSRLFDFSRIFEGGGGDLSVGSFDSGAVSVDFSDVNSSSARRERRRRRRKRRSSNRMYRIESVKTSCWYREFLKPGPVRELTYELSGPDRHSEFRDFFRMPLSKLDELVDILIRRGYIKMPRSLFRRGEFQERAELLVMAALHILAKGATFKCCRTLTHISTSEVRKFFFAFLDAMVDMKDEYIFLPPNVTALNRVMQAYSNLGLPGACGSMDVVHIKWSACPAGDHNRAKGKEGYPTIAFQCITDNTRRFLSVYGPQFGTRNDKEIVKLDPFIRKIRSGWYSKVWWRYFAQQETGGGIGMERGVYVICDNGDTCDGHNSFVLTQRTSLHTRNLDIFLQILRVFGRTLSARLVL